MQEFWEFTNKLHTLAKCTEKNCATEDFFKEIKEVVFDEELSYDKRRLFFTDVCSSNKIYRFTMPCSSFITRAKKI